MAAAENYRYLFSRQGTMTDEEILAIARAQYDAIDAEEN